MAAEGRRDVKARPKNEGAREAARLKEIARRGISIASTTRALPSQQPTQATETIFNDLQSLAKLTKHYTTALTLALKEVVENDGHLAILRSLIDTTNKLVFAASSLAPSDQLWEKEIRFSCFLALFEAIDGLATILAKVPLERPQILQATGQIWEATDSILLRASHSRTQAFEKFANDLLETFEDALAEVKAMVARTTDSTNQDEDPDEEESLTSDERERASAVSIMLRMARLLIKRVIKPPIKANVEELHPRLSRLIESGDDLVASCHSPQDRAILAEDTVTFVTAVYDLAREDGIEQRLNKVDLSKDSDSEDTKWRRMCMLQIRKASEPLLVEGCVLPDFEE